MKRIVFLLSIFILAACGQPDDPRTVTLTGVIENPSDLPVEFVFYRDYTNNHKEVVTLKLDGEKYFSETFDMPEAAVGILRHGRNSIKLFLKPGDNLHIEAKGSSLQEFSGISGSAAADNRCFIDYQRTLENKFSGSFYNNQMKEKNPEEFIKLVDEVTLDKLAFLQRCSNKTELSEEFEAFLHTEIIYDKYNRLLAFPSTHQRLNQLDNPVVLPAGYYSFLEEALEGGNTQLNSEAYVSFLMSYLNYQADLQAERFAEDASPNEINYVLAEELLKGRPAEYIQAISINREFNYGELDKAMELYDDFMETSQTLDYRNRVSRTLEGIKALMPGNPAPDFTMTDIDGKQVSLSDYKGKVVYLKFWASWCGPCMRQVPPAAELKERMKGHDDLVFMYVSIDTDTTAWRNAIERNNIKGVHFNTPGRERGVPALYQVKWIPSFFIIGRDGNMFDNRPPQPSDENVDEVLLRALAE